MAFVSCLTDGRDKIEPLLVTSPSSHYVLYASKDVWHSRLGHPSTRIFDQILTSRNIRTKMNEKVSFSEACKYGNLIDFRFHSLHHMLRILWILFTQIFGTSTYEIS